MTTGLYNSTKVWYNTAMANFRRMKIENPASTGFFGLNAKEERQS
jgi:hypothetical protein